MRKAMVMLAVIILLNSASLAAAECAWVLWEKKINNGIVGWSIVKAAPAFDRCEAHRLIEWKKWSDVLGEGPGTERVEGEQLMVRAPGGIAIREWHCLPDTIDPRAKKD